MSPLPRAVGELAPLRQNVVRSYNVRIAALAVLVGLVACGSGWKQAPPSEPEPETVTVYPSVAPAPHVVTPPTRKPMTPGRSTIPANAQPCPAMPNATLASIQLSFINQTSFQHDLCAEVDRALGLLSYLTTLAPVGFKIDVSADFALASASMR